MPGFFALGSGFLGAANQKLDDIQDERKQNRRLAMEVFVKDTLPKVRAAQAKDDAFVSSINGMMNDDYYKGNPALAYYSKKWQDRTGKDEMAFREYAVSNQLPPEVKSVAEAELSKYFNIDPSSSQLSWKTAVPSVPTAQPQQQGPRPSFYDRLLGKGNMQQDATQGIKQGASMAGVDPNASTTTRSDTMSVPGGFQSKDLAAEKRAETAFGIFARTPDAVKNFDKFINDYATKGADAALKGMQFIPPEVRQDKEFQQGMRQSLASAIVANVDNMKDPTGALKGMAAGGFSIQSMVDILGKGLRTPEEKAKLAADLKNKYSMPDGEIDWISTIADSDKMRQLFPDDATRKAVQESVVSYISQKRQTAAEAQYAALGIKPPEGTSSGVAVKTADDIRAQQSEQPSPNEPAANTQPAPAPQVNNQDFLTVDQNAQFQSRDALAEQKANSLKDNKKLLDDIVSASDPKNMAVSGVRTINVDAIKNHRNPVALAKAADNKEAQRLVGANFRTDQNILQKALDDEDYGNQLQDVIKGPIAQYFPKFDTMEDAKDGAEPGSWVQIKTTKGGYGVAMVPFK